MKKATKKEKKYQIKRVYGYEFKYDVWEDIETSRTFQSELKIPRLLIATDGKYFGVSVYREDKNDEPFTRKRANEIALGRLEKIKTWGSAAANESDLQIKNSARTISDVGDFGRLYFHKKGFIPRYGKLSNLLKDSKKVGVVSGWDGICRMGTKYEGLTAEESQALSEGSKEKESLKIFKISE